MKKIGYEYDSERGAMVRTSDDGMPLIIRKREPRWKALGGLDDSYSRAIYIGQGCWVTSLSQILAIIYCIVQVQNFWCYF